MHATTLSYSTVFSLYSTHTLPEFRKIRLVFTLTTGLSLLVPPFTLFHIRQACLGNTNFSSSDTVSVHSIKEYTENLNVICGRHSRHPLCLLLPLSILCCRLRGPSQQKRNSMSV